MSVYLDRFIKESEFSNGYKDNLLRLMNRISELGYDKDFIFHCTYDEIENLLVLLLPSSKLRLFDYCKLLSSYLRWSISHFETLPDDGLRNIIKLDKDVVWKKIRPSVNKFISHTQYLELIEDIEKTSDLNNSLYYSTLIKALYEGIYNENLYIFKEIRASDLKEHFIHLKDNDEEYDLEISTNLIESLKELSTTTVWLRRNKHGNNSEIKLVGKYDDSCFKIELRSNGKDVDTAAKNFYWNKIRKIEKEYVGYTLRPLHIYLSGIMYRICENLKANNITVQEAFIDDVYSPTVYKIINDELKRVHYNTDSRYFRAQIKCFIDVFE